MGQGTPRQPPRSTTVLYVAPVPGDGIMERPIGPVKSSRPGEADRDVLWEAANAFRTTQALYVVAKLGIPDLLRDGPKTSEDLARRAKAHPRSLFRLLRYLAALGFFTQDKSNRFGLTPKSEPLLTDAPNSMRPMVIFLGEDQYLPTGRFCIRCRAARPPSITCTAWAISSTWPSTRRRARDSTPRWPRGSANPRIPWTATTCPADASSWTWAEGEATRSCRSSARTQR